MKGGKKEGAQKVGVPNVIHSGCRQVVRVVVAEEPRPGKYKPRNMCVHGVGMVVGKPLYVGVANWGNTNVEGGKAQRGQGTSV